MHKYRWMHFVHSIYAYECVFMEYMNLCMQNRFDFTVSETSFKLIDMEEKEFHRYHG